MKVLQILPELNSGGVERGTLEVARRLVAEGHEALVVSNGGRMVPALERTGARHLAMPVHKKRLGSLLLVRPLRRLLLAERPDVLHIRSRAPGWVAWLAWRKLPPDSRPRLVSTVHGFYSVNPYSAVMTRGERVIAVSESVREYVLKHYTRVEPARLTVIHRGVDPAEFPAGHRPDAAWLARWRHEHPELAGRKTILLPGRITRWKGHEDLLRLIATLRAQGVEAHGVVAGDTHPHKRAFGVELRGLAERLGVGDRVAWLGHREDVREVMAACDLTCSLSRDPEAFGRVSLEALALGRPVAGYDHGGVAEQLRAIYPAGRVPPRDEAALARVVRGLLESAPPPAPVPREFTQDAMCGATLEVYRELLASARE
jgi:glycosyltransferase involved in cell wall biosynthesis